MVLNSKLHVSERRPWRFFPQWLTAPFSTIFQYFYMEERSVCVKGGGGLHLAQQHTSVSEGLVINIEV